MNLTFLGTGTSHGIPAIGCTCSVCRSADPHNRRRRTSVYVRADDYHLVIDTPLDFREQVLTFGVERVDAVLLTHPHADHIFGFDDLRRFCYLQKMTLPVYASTETVARMSSTFDYVLSTGGMDDSLPRVAFHSVSSEFACGPLRVTPLEVAHGSGKAYGYLVQHEGRSVAYIPDCSGLEEGMVSRLRGVDVMILNALRHRPHPKHMALEESIATLQAIGAGSSYITHLCHDLDHEATQALLPPRCHVPYDGLQVEC